MTDRRLYNDSQLVPTYGYADLLRQKRDGNPNVSLTKRFDRPDFKGEIERSAWREIQTCHCGSIYVYENYDDLTFRMRSAHLTVPITTCELMSRLNDNEVNGFMDLQESGVFKILNPIDYSGLTKTGLYLPCGDWCITMIQDRQKCGTTHTDIMQHYFDTFERVTRTSDSGEIVKQWRVRAGRFFQRMSDLWQWNKPIRLPNECESYMTEKTFTLMYEKQKTIGFNFLQLKGFFNSPLQSWMVSLEVLWLLYTRGYFVDRTGEFFDAEAYASVIHNFFVGRKLIHAHRIFMLLKAGKWQTRPATNTRGRFYPKAFIMQMAMMMWYLTRNEKHSLTKILECLYSEKYSRYHVSPRDPRKFKKDAKQRSYLRWRELTDIKPNVRHQMMQFDDEEKLVKATVPTSLLIEVDSSDDEEDNSALVRAPDTDLPERIPDVGGIDEVNTELPSRGMADKFGAFCYRIARNVFNGAVKASSENYIRSKALQLEPAPLDKLLNQGVEIKHSVPLLDKIYDAIKAFLAPFLEKGKVLLDMLDSMITSIKSRLLASLSEDTIYFILGLIVFIVIAVLLYYYWDSLCSSVTLVIDFLTGLVSSIGITVTSATRKFFKRYFSSEKKESDDDVVPDVTHEIGDSPIGMVIGIVSSYLFKNELSPVKIRDINNFTRFGKDYASLMTWVFSHFKKIIGLAVDHFTGYQITTEIKDRKDFDAFCKEYGEISLEHQGMRKYVENDSLRERVDNLYRVMLSRQDILNAETLTQPEKLHFTRMCDRVREWYGQKIGIDTVAVTRPEPIWVHIMGEKGIGKTHFTEIFLSHVYYLTYGENYKPSYRYERRDSDYHEGYYGQFALTMDDIFQLEDKTSRAKTSMDIIQYVTSQPCPLTMPGLEDKGVTFMTSKMIFSTTNTYGIPTDLGIKESSALARRCAFPVTMRVKKEYKDKNGLLNISKLFKAEGDIENIYNDIWEFDIHEGLGPEFTTTRPTLTGRVVRTVNFTELGVLVSESIKRNHRYNVEMHEILDKPKWQTVPTNTIPKETFKHEIFGLSMLERMPDWLRKPFTRMSAFAHDADGDTWFDNVVSGNLFQNQACMEHWAEVDGFEQSYQWALGLDNDACAPIWNTYLDWILGPGRQAGQKLLNVNQFLQTIMTNQNAQNPDGVASRAFLAVPVKRRIYLLSYMFPGEPINVMTIVNGMFSSIAGMPTVIGQNVWYERKIHIDRGFKWHCTYYADVAYTFENWLKFHYIKDRLVGQNAWNFVGQSTALGVLGPCTYDFIRARAVDFLQMIIDSDALICGIIYAGCALVIIVSLAQVMRKHFQGRPRKVKQQSGDHRIGGHGARVSQTGRYNKKSHVGARKMHSMRRAFIYRQQGEKEEVIPEAEEQGNNPWLAIRNKICESTCIFEMVYEKPAKSQRAYGQFIFGSVAVIPEHYLHWGVNLQKIILHPNSERGGQLEFSKDQFTIDYLENEDGNRIDLAILKFDKTQAFPDLYHHLPTYDNIDMRGLRPVLLRRIDEMGTRETVEERADKAFFGAVNVTDNQGAFKREESGVIRMVGIQSHAGWCGQPYAVKETTVPFKLIGIHTAGFEGEAVCTPIYREMFEKYREGHVSVGSHPNMVHQMLILDCPVAHLPGLEPVAAFIKRPYMPDKSNIIPSYIQTGIKGADGNILECPYDVTKKPAKLCREMRPDGTIHSPYLDALERGFGTSYTLSYTRAQLDLFEEEDNFDGIIEKHLERKVSILTLEEAVLGVPQLHIKPIDMQTSAGFPWTQKGLKKQDLIFIKDDGKGVRSVTFSKLFMEYYNHQMSLLKQGLLPPTYVVQTLKDELRDLERVRIGKTRLFDAANVVDVLICRQYFADLVSMIEASRHGCSVQVGINPHSVEWKAIYDRLFNGTASLNDLRFIMGDVSRWDKSIFIALAYYLADYIRKYYEQDADWRIARLLLIASLQTYQVSPLGLYRSRFGVCSGHYLTSIINSVINHFFHKVIYKTVVPIELKYDFLLYVVMLYYGDDSAGSVADRVREYFNMLSLKHWFRELFNIEYTSPYKGANNEAFCSSDQLIFLKRAFKKEDCFIYPVLDRESILNMTLWMTKGNNKAKQIEQIRDSCKSALMEWFYYGEGPYEKHRRILNERLVALKADKIHRSYLDTKQAWVEGFAEQW